MVGGLSLSANATSYCLLKPNKSHRGFSNEKLPLPNGFFHFAETARPVEATETKYPGNANLKVGKSSYTTILFLIETGDGGIEAAKRNGNIDKVHHVDQTVKKVFVYLPFFRKIETVVYGE